MATRFVAKPSQLSIGREHKLPIHSYLEIFTDGYQICNQTISLLMATRFAAKPFSLVIALWNV